MRMGKKNKKGNDGVLGEKQLEGTRQEWVWGVGYVIDWCLPRRFGQERVILVLIDKIGAEGVGEGRRESWKFESN